VIKVILRGFCGFLMAAGNAGQALVPTKSIETGRRAVAAPVAMMNRREGTLADGEMRGRRGAGGMTGPARTLMS